MAGKASFLKIDNQSPLIQLVVSFLIVAFAGTFLFYLFVFAGSMIFSTGIREMLMIPPPDAGIKENMILRYVQFCQQFSIFIIPSLIIIYLIRGENENLLGMNRSPGIISVLLVIILALLIIPVTSFTGILNSKMNLPGWLSGVQEWMRTKEDDASDITQLLIVSSDFGSMALNTIILAVVPAFGEELLFRGVLQKLLIRIFRSGHAGIWITSIIFSTIHLQFFGFLPRLILGLSFGYLFYWSRNLWMPVIAHFANNAVPVIMLYYVDPMVLKEKFQIIRNQGMVIAVVQLMLCIMIFAYFRSKSGKSQRYFDHEDKIRQ